MKSIRIIFVTTTLYLDFQITQIIDQSSEAKYDYHEGTGKEITSMTKVLVEAQ